MKATTMRQVTLTISLPWSRTPFRTSVYGRTADTIQHAIRQTIRRYADKYGVGVSAVDYEVVWGKPA